MFNDLMENIEWFFNLHDKNKDGYLSKDEVLTLSESLLVRLSVGQIYSHSSPLLVHLPLRDRRCLPWRSEPFHV